MQKYEFSGHLSPRPKGTENAMCALNGEVYLASDVDARIAELEKALRYWMPDETMVPPEHQKAWDEHIRLMVGSS